MSKNHFWPFFVIYTRWGFSKKKKKKGCHGHPHNTKECLKKTNKPIWRKLPDGRKDGRTLIHKIVPARVQLNIEVTNIERADKVTKTDNILQRTNCPVKKFSFAKNHKRKKKEFIMGYKVFKRFLKRSQITQIWVFCNA